MDGMDRADARAATRKLVAEALAAGDAYRWNEELYRCAGRDASAIPWAELTPNPHLVSWLGNRPEGWRNTALVVGCGLGDDAEALAAHGWRVIAFDVSESAIRWCRERFPGSPVRYWIADLFAMPSGASGGFDLVVEAYTLQTFPADVRQRAIETVAKLVAPGGTFLVIARGRDEAAAAGEFPWPLTRDELAAFTRHGLEQVRFEDFLDDETPPVRRFRAEYRRPVLAALQTHDVVLRGDLVILRPLTENDWSFVIPLWNNPAVVAWAGSGGEVHDPPEAVMAIYRKVSREAYQFIVERDGEGIGDMHLQRMNLPRLLNRYPNRDLRRIDIALKGEAVWGKGLGAEAIRLATRFGFEQERADLIFGPSISYANPRSFLAFAKSGYELQEGTDWVAESRSADELDVVCRREIWEAFHQDDRPLVIRKAVPSDHAEAFAVQMEAARWLASRGIGQWKAYLAEPEKFAGFTADWIAAGELWVAEMAGTVAGMFCLAAANDWARAVWPDASAAERYVWKLAIRRAFAGRGLGLRLLRRAELLALAAGATTVRLDCAADNPALLSYYERAGYTPCGAVTAHAFQLARFERRLG